MPEYSGELECARREAQLLELGKNNRTIRRKIRDAIGNDECVIIGGPPCQAYSLVGRSRNKGNKDYHPSKDERNFLYEEYLELIAIFQPCVFVMENVKGLLTAKVEDRLIFEEMIADLQDPCFATKKTPSKPRQKHKYRIVSLSNPSSDEPISPRDFVIKTEDFGIPQRRHRVILLGIREDLFERWDNSLVLKRENIVPVSSVIGDLPELRSGITKMPDTLPNWHNAISNVRGIYPQLQKLGHRKLVEIMEDSITENQQFQASRGRLLGQRASSRLAEDLPKKLATWYRDRRLKWICNHESRGHMESDLHRYLFCASWSLAAERLEVSTLTPHPSDYPEKLKPKHKSFDSGNFPNRFRTQSATLPGTTVTSHISKDGHYFIHYDAKQCRSLTVREAARIQTFPDNYFFVGNNTEQYVQVGNAVPPYLAFKIAKAVHALVSQA